MRLDITAGERLVMKDMDDKCWAGSSPRKV